jgi:hypothetical protein
VSACEGCPRLRTVQPRPAVEVLARAGSPRPQTVSTRRIVEVQRGPPAELWLTHSPGYQHSAAIYYYPVGPVPPVAAHELPVRSPSARSHSIHCAASGIQTTPSTIQLSAEEPGLFRGDPSSPFRVRAFSGERGDRGPLRRPSRRRPGTPETGLAPPPPLAGWRSSARRRRKPSPAAPRREGVRQARHRVCR